MRGSPEMPEFMTNVTIYDNDHVPSPSQFKIGKSVQKLLDHCSSIESHSPVRSNLPEIGRQTSMMVFKKKSIINNSFEITSYHDEPAPKVFPQIKNAISKQRKIARNSIDIQK